MSSSDPVAMAQKKCTRCRAVKLLEEFSRYKNGPMGRDLQCRECRAEYKAKYRKERTVEQIERQRRNSKAWYEKHKPKLLCRMRDASLRKNYGITHERYGELLAAQGGKCAICGTDNPGIHNAYFHIDHDHDTGVVRGVLCEWCNKGLGHFKDEPRRLEAAIQYLARHGKVPAALP